MCVNGIFIFFFILINEVSIDIAVGIHYALADTSVGMHGKYKTFRMNSE